MAKIRFTGRELLLLLALSSVNFTHIVDFMIVMPLGPQLMRIFSITPQQFGLIVSAYTFAAGVSGLLSAFFIDRFDRKKSLLFFFSGFCIGTYACGVAPDYNFLLLARLVTGAFGGVLSSLVLSIVGDNFEAGRRGSAMGMIMTGFSAASVFGVPFSIYLATIYGWHAPFFFLGTLALILGLVLWRVLPPMDLHLTGDTHTKPLQVLTNVLRDSTQWMSLIFMFFLIFGQFTIIPFFSPSLVANAGLPEDKLPFVYLVGGGISIITGPIIGWLSDRFGKLKIFMIFGTISLIPIYVVTHLQITPIWILLMIVAGFFVVMGGRMIPAMAMVTGAVQPQHRGSFMSFMSSTQQFASAMASLVAGMIITRSETGTLLQYPIVGFIAIAASIGAIFLAYKAKLQ